MKVEASLLKCKKRGFAFDVLAVKLFNDLERVICSH